MDTMTSTCAAGTTKRSVLVRDAQMLVWVLLVGATVLTAVLGFGQGDTSTVAGVLVIAIGCVKLRLVMIHFMELGSAPTGLRLLAEGYSAVVLVSLLAIYLLV